MENNFNDYNELFRYMLIRAPSLESAGKGKRVNAYGEETPLLTSLGESLTRTGSVEGARQVAIGFRTSPSYLKDLQNLPFNMEAVAGCIEEYRKQEISVKDFKEALKERTRVTLTLETVKNLRKNLADTLIANLLMEGEPPISNAITANYLKICSFLEAVFAGEIHSDSKTWMDDYFRQSVLILPPVLDKLRSKNTYPSDQNQNGASNGSGTSAGNLPEPAKTETQILKEKLSNCKIAKRELSLLATNERKLKKVNSLVDDRETLGKIQKQLSELTDLVKHRTGEQTDTGGTIMPQVMSSRDTNPEIFKEKYVLSEESYSTLKESTKTILSDLGFKKDDVEPETAIRLIEQQIRIISSDLQRSIANDAIVASPPPPPEVSTGPFYVEGQLYSGTPEGKAVSLKSGVGEMIVVKQKLIGYELGDFAHVENILQGETRERTHRKLSKREEEWVEEEETVKETEKDLQTTERSELETEVQNTIKEESQFKAGLSVGYKGGGFEVSANVGTEMMDSAEETRKRAARYGQEIVTRAAERVREKYRKEKRKKVLEETEEINLHKIDNSINPKGHIRGIYRWLNKVYEVKLFKYGRKQLYFDVLIPEPSRFYWHTFFDHPPKGSTDRPPDPPEVERLDDNNDLKLFPLRPDDLDESNYLEYVATYQVLEVPPPPAEYITVPYVNHSGVSMEDESGNNTKPSIPTVADIIEIPEGYAAYRASVNMWDATPVMEDTTTLAGYEMHPYKMKNGVLSTMSVIIGSTLFDPGCPQGQENSLVEFDPYIQTRIFKKESIVNTDDLHRVKYDDATGLIQGKDDDKTFEIEGNLSITIRPYKVEYAPPYAHKSDVEKSAFIVGVDVFCHRTDRAFRQWQIAAYTAIIQAYQQQLANYEDKKAVESIQQGVVISGRNPEENKKIIEEELKKQFIYMFTYGRHKPLKQCNGFSTYYDGDANKPPRLKMDTVQEIGEFVQFFEHVFDWSQLVYVLYPYFWGDKSRWAERMIAEDTDSNFKSFLKSGAARVYIPVRVGFEKLVINYLQSSGDKNSLFTSIWRGDDPVFFNDKKHLPIHDEIYGSWEKDDEPVEIVTLPELIIPTDLVILQDLSEIQGIRDTLQGTIAAPVNMSLSNGE